MKRFKFGSSKETPKEKEDKKKSKTNVFFELINFHNSRKKQKILYFDNLAYGTGLKSA